jgi:hypothetical protein
LADEYKVTVNWDGGPFKIEKTESVIRKSDLPGGSAANTNLLNRVIGAFAAD